MIVVKLPRGIPSRDFHTYIARRFPDVRKRALGYVLGDGHAGVFISRTFTGGINIRPTVITPWAILWLLLGIGFLAWFLVWHAEAWKIATDTAEIVSDDFDGKISQGT